ncbi:hypothetical protein J8281_14315 [Aquimarina sp. U1-2]|uniref:hypothetical protein n=1 Tax=Aquimarina sp. U1-2 TaxID=2823141 RepID=UPI001AEC8EAD|nr:hypothetical protein [Aquimarina sp. U1-2]MBP2833366.1 hypothetical protein [Aquimarina sp. U1-2]
MKQAQFFIVFCIALLCTACLQEDDTATPFFYNAVAIEEVIIPDQFNPGKTYDIEVTYFRPTTCHSFSGIEYNGFRNERTIVIINVVIDNQNEPCEELERTDLRKESLSFTAGNEDSYIFKFWQNRNEQGEDQYLTIEVPVIEEEQTTSGLTNEAFNRN